MGQGQMRGQSPGNLLRARGGVRPLLRDDAKPASRLRANAGIIEPYPKAFHVRRERVAEGWRPVLMRKRSQA
jgi:hypothetical protein